MSEGVAIVGCGLLGSAAARVLRAAGYGVLAWNRTAERARALAAEGIAACDAIEDAVHGADLVLVAVTTYEAVEQALAPVGDWAGRTAAVLTTGVPGDAERTAAWLGARGAAVLDAAVLGYPDDLGRAETVIVVAGSGAAWRRHERALRALAGAARHVAEAVGAANAIDVAATGAFYTVALGAFFEGAAYARTRGVGADDLVAAVEAWLPVLRRDVHEGAAAVAAGRHASDQATIDVYGEAAASWLQEMREAGGRAALIAAMSESLVAARAAGLGRLGVSALAQLDSPRSPKL